MSNFVKASPLEGNFAHIHAVHHDVVAGNNYVGEAGEVSFIVCNGYMVGVLHNGICKGGIARWPLFEASTNFQAMYDLVNPPAPVEEREQVEEQKARV